MRAPCAIVLVVLLACRPVIAEGLDPEAARRFVLGKLFTFTCFDGSRGAGRVYGDGSVIGTSRSVARGRCTQCGCRRERLRSNARTCALL